MLVSRKIPFVLLQHIFAPPQGRGMLILMLSFMVLMELHLLWEQVELMGLKRSVHRDVISVDSSRLKWREE